MPGSVVLHLHLHQPPREDAWLGHLPRDRDAAPDHDLTAAAERTCYRALVAARVTAPDGRVRRIVDTLAYSSFDVAPSLLAWLAREAPATYSAVLAADRAGTRRTGRGNAIAHPYHHVILPLLSRRDKVTEVRWGLAEFTRHFGRAATGMWLPETAVDDETLDVLAECGVRFTLLAPHQCDAVPPGGHAGSYRTRSGREIALFTYDADIARDVAFGPLIDDGVAWGARLRARLREHATPTAGDGAMTEGVADPLVAIAANAETFGLHHRFGDMALAAVLDALEQPEQGPAGAVYRPTPVVNFDAALAAAPATHPVQIVERTSWSCAHDLGRWREECGCRRDASTHQRWRAPLVAALAELRGAVAERFAREGARLFAHVPGGADAVRDAYNDVLSDARGAGDTLALTGGYLPATTDPVWARELLDMTREGLAMADADGLGADDLAEPATRAILAHAARAASLLGPAASAATERLGQALVAATANRAADGTGRALLERVVPSGTPLAVRIAAGAAASRVFGAPDATPHAWRAGVTLSSEGPPHVRVTDRRLGTSATYAVVVDVPSPATARHAYRHADGDGAGGAGSRSAHAAAGPRTYRLADVDPRGVTILVRPVPGATGARPAFADALGAALKLADIPEPARERVELALRRAVVQRLLDPDDRERLAAGEAQLRVLADAALVRAIDALGAVLHLPTAAGSAIARVLGLADLAESAGAGTPFDAQTALYRLGASLPVDARQQLAPVAWRLGFSARGWRELDSDGSSADRRT